MARLLPSAPAPPWGGPTTSWSMPCSVRRSTVWAYSRVVTRTSCPRSRRSETSGRKKGTCGEFETSIQTRTRANLADVSTESRQICLQRVDRSVPLRQTVDVDPNPFRIAGELLREEMIDRDAEATRLLTLAEGGHASRLVAPRRYGKTSLLRRVLLEAGDAGWATAL